MTGHPQILTGLSLSVGAVVLAAVIDTEAGTVRIVQRGETVNGSAAAIESARELLRGRVRRFLPKLKMIGD